MLLSRLPRFTLPSPSAPARQKLEWTFTKGVLCMCLLHVSGRPRIYAGISIFDINCALFLLHTSHVQGLFTESSRIESRRRWLATSETSTLSQFQRMTWGIRARMAVRCGLSLVVRRDPELALKMPKGGSGVNNQIVQNWNPKMFACSSILVTDDLPSPPCQHNHIRNKEVPLHLILHSLPSTVRCPFVKRTGNSRDCLDSEEM